MRSGAHRRNWTETPGICRPGQWPSPKTKGDGLSPMLMARYRERYPHRSAECPCPMETTQPRAYTGCAPKNQHTRRGYIGAVSRRRYATVEIRSWSCSIIPGDGDEPSRSTQIRTHARRMNVDTSAARVPIYIFARTVTSEPSATRTRLAYV